LCGLFTAQRHPTEETSGDWNAALQAKCPRAGVCSVQTHGIHMQTVQQRKIMGDKFEIGSTSIMGLVSLNLDCYKRMKMCSFACGGDDYWYNL
jgi:hypothetical protein